MLFTFMAVLLALVDALALRQFEHFDGVLAARAPEGVVPQELERPRPILGLDEAVAERPARRIARCSVRMQGKAIAHRRPRVDKCVADALEPVRPPLVRRVGRRRPGVQEQVARHPLISFRLRWSASETPSPSLLSGLSRSLI